MNEMTALTINLKPFVSTEREFEELCRANPELRLELTASGEVAVMSPTGSETGARGASIAGQLWQWNERTRLGRVFDSSAGFRLANGAIRSPDASWVSLARWRALPSSQRRRFAPLAPDFVVELCSPTDDWDTLHAKMLEYVASGVRLGWLIDPEHRRVLVYAAGQPASAVEAPAALAGDPVLPGFVLDRDPVFAEI